MKKTLITLLALSGIAMGATELQWKKSNTQGSDSSDVNLISVSGWNYFWNLIDPTGVTREDKLKNGNAYAAGGVLTSITSEGNSDYSLTIGDGTHTIDVTDDVYFASVKSTASALTLNFGAEGSLTAATKYDQWGGAIQFAQNSTVTLTATVSLEQRISAASGDLVIRTLISSTDTTEDAMWNVTNKLTVKAVGLEGLENVGLVKDTSTLKKGQYGYIHLTSGDENSGADGIALVYKVPEPTTATLSLLALAGLAARRRRR